ncbi:MAG: sensor histidine kinase [Kiritimatiellia bacterium]
MDPQKRRRFSYAWTAAAWVALIALLAGGGLFALRLWHGRAVHQAAALAVGERGQWLAMSLALRAAAAAEAGEADAWREFSGLLRSVREVENDLEYVAVRRGGVTLFREHAETLAAAADPGDFHFDGLVSIGRQRLTTGAEPVPVVTFSVAVTNPRTESVALELGLRRGAVEWEERPARRAIDSFYRLSLATIAVCFAICLALVAGVVRREERRERARRQEEHLAFSGVLANGIVHDFRNPMSSLRLDAQMLEKEAGRGAESRPARIAELAGRMRHTLDRMEKVFQEFLALARPAAAAPERLELGACAQECIEMLAPRFETSGVAADVRRPAEPVVVRVDGAAVKRAVLNVLLNATQHAGAGGRVTVEVARDGGRAQLEVRDTGPGIPKAERERIFEMFYTTRPQGTGLGLFLARTAVAQNGGTLAAVGPEGPGACFRLEFPLAEKEPP